MAIAAGRFALGQFLYTPAAAAVLEREYGDDWLAEMLRLLGRHKRGDWGHLDPADKAENELSVEQGFRILSAYLTPTGTKVWFITEADRSATTCLLPSDY